MKGDAHVERRRIRMRGAYTYHMVSGQSDPPGPCFEVARWLSPAGA